MIRSNRRLTIRENSDHTNISHGSVQNILTTDLNMSWVSAKFVSRDLTVKHKQQHLPISLELRDCASLVSSILGNETWISGYDPVTRVKVVNGNHPGPLVWRKARQSSSNIKMMMIMFLSLMELRELRMYPGTLQWTQNIIRAIREFKKQFAWKTAWEMSKRFFILHHDVSFHTSLLVGQFLPLKILGCDLIHIIHRHHATSGSTPKAKWPFRVKKFESIQDIKPATTAQLKTRYRTSRTASESGKNNGISVFQQGVYFKGVNGNASFTVIFFI